MSGRPAELSAAPAPPPPDDVTPHVPAATSPPSAEFTPRAWLLGLGVGTLLAITNVYMGLSLGIWESGCTLSALLAFGGLSVLGRRGRPPTVLETNLAQSTAVSVGALPASAGLLGAVPALALMNRALPGWMVAAWGVGLGALGVWFAWLSRRRLLEEERLPFPTGAATAELISTLHSKGEEYRARARGLGFSGLVSAAIIALKDSLQVIPQLTALPAGLGVLGLGVAWSPMMLGTGILLGSHASLSLLLGALLAWGPGARGLVSAQWVTGPEAVGGWLLWPGLGLVVGASLPSLLSQVRALPRLVGDLRGLGVSREDRDSRVGRRVSWALVPGVLLCLGPAAWALELNAWQFLLALAVAFPLCAVCARATGQSDIAPMSQVGQLAQAGFGLVAPGREGLNLAAGALVSGAASHTSASLWSLQSSRLLGASPSRQFLAQLSGLLWGAAVAVPTYVVLMRPGSAPLSMPSARQFEMVARLSSQGLAGLPPGAAGALGLAVVLGALLSVAGARGVRWLPSAAAMGIGLFIPSFVSLTLCLGALLASALTRLRPAWGQPLQSVGAGALLGESLTIVLSVALGALFS